MYLTLMLLVAYLANTEWCKKPEEKMKRMIFHVLKPYAAGGLFGQYKMMQKTWRNEKNDILCT